MDLPALASVKSIHQWNGSFGCGNCEVEGQSVPSGNGTCRAYPWQQKKSQSRTKERMEDQAISAMLTGQPVVSAYIHV